jgi:hypothetical protein
VSLPGAGARQLRMSGLDRLGLFVPAVMTVGLLFWLASGLSRIVRGVATQSRHRRAAVAGAAVAARTAGTTIEVDRLGLRPRSTYGLTAVSLIGGSVYVAVGSAANFFNPTGYVRDIAWLLTLAVVVSVAALVYGVAAAALFVTWPDPPTFLRGALLRTPLGCGPTVHDAGTRARTMFGGAAAIAAALAGLVVVATVGSRTRTAAATRWLNDQLVGFDPPAELILPGVGAIGVVLALLLPIGLAAARCRVMATAVATVVAMAVIATLVVREIADPVVGNPPDVTVLVAVLVAGLTTIAAAVLGNRSWVTGTVALLLAGAVASTAADRVTDTVVTGPDAAVGLLMGVALSFTAAWMVARISTHRDCHHCPWSEADPDVAVSGALPVHPDAHQILELVARVTAALMASAVLVVALRINLPAETVEYGLHPSWEQFIEAGIAALVVCGALVAWKWDGVGASILAVAASAAGVYTAIQLRPAVAVVVTSVFMIPAVLLWLSWQHDRRPGEILAVTLVLSALLGGTWAGASTVHDALFGPTHPASPLVAETLDRVEWVWAGNLSATTITVTARIPERDADAAVVLTPAHGGPTLRTREVTPDVDGLVRFDVDRLTPNTGYTYQILVDGAADLGRGYGTFTTPAQGPFSFTVTAAACARTGSSGAVFDTIRANDPLLHLAIGDIHYANIESTNASRYINALTQVLTAPAQAALARAVPMAYVWDDHDYGSNDADATNPGRTAVRDAWRRAVPNTAVTSGDGPINQAFTVGRVRFVITDTRSERTPDTMLGAEQLAWLIDELETASRTHAVVVWVNPTPWVGPATVGDDTWASWSPERAAIADAIVAADITNLIMVAGDAHMVAIDDGTNTAIGPGRTGGFPLLHAAPLDRPGSIKGGPYSHGVVAEPGQFGVLRFDDDGGDTVTVVLEGRNWRDQIVMSLAVDIAVPAGLGVPA